MICEECLDFQHPLSIALWQRPPHMECFQELFCHYEHIDDINERDDQDHTALDLAALSSNVQAIEILLQHPKINVEAVSPFDNGGPDIVKFKNGRNAKGRLECTRTRPLNTSTALLLAAQYGTKETVEVLLEEGHANINAKCDKNETVLYKAAKNRSFGPQVLEYLIQRGCDVNCDDKRGETPLHNAAKAGLTENIKVLICNGADMERTGRYRGYTALGLAAENCHPESIEVLLEHGANPNARQGTEHLLHRDSPTRTSWSPIPLQPGDPEPRRHLGDSPLSKLLATYFGNFWHVLYPDEIRTINDSIRYLIKYGGEVDHSIIGMMNDETEDIVASTSWAPEDYPGMLHHLFRIASTEYYPEKYLRQHFGDHWYEASCEGYEVVVKMFCLFADSGADPNRLLYNLTPLQLACHRGWSEMANRLLTPKLQVDLRGQQGQTALHFAARSGMATTVRGLLNAGAAVMARDKIGETPLDKAKRWGRHECQGILEDFERASRIENRKRKSVGDYERRWKWARL